MKSSTTWVLLGALAAGTVACGPGTSTPDSSVTGDGDITDATVGSEGGSGTCTSTTPSPFEEGDGGCVGFQQCSTDGNGFCPAQITNNAMRPQFVITQIDISTPGSLRATSAVGNLLNNSIGSGSFLWGLDFNLATNSLRTGAIARGFSRVAGQGFLQQTLMFAMGGAPTTGGGSANRWDPVTTPATLMGETFNAMQVPIVTVPVYEENNGPLLTELPLRNATLSNVTMRAMRNCVGLTRPGGNYNSCLGKQWQTTEGSGASATTFGGRLEADITVADARNVAIPSLMSNLCNIVAGRNCEMTPQAMWPNQPDRNVGGGTDMNAWHIVANFAAVAVRIAQ